MPQLVMKKPLIWVLCTVHGFFVLLDFLLWKHSDDSENEDGGQLPYSVWEKTQGGQLPKLEWAVSSSGTQP